jgi:hypothetical protein
MGVGQTGPNLQYDRPGVGPVHRTRVKPADHAAQELSFQQLHRKKRDVAISVEFVNFDDIAVR